MADYNYYFSPTTLGFFPSFLEPFYKTSGSWPDDAVGVSDQDFATYASTEPPLGKKLGVVNGQPAWVDIPATTGGESSASGTTATS